LNGGRVGDKQTDGGGVIVGHGVPGKGKETQKWARCSVSGRKWLVEKVMGRGKRSLGGEGEKKMVEGSPPGLRATALHGTEKYPKCCRGEKGKRGGR